MVSQYLLFLQVLLPFSMMVTLSGPKDEPAMDINVTVSPISLTISPAIVRLIIHATKTLIPEKVNMIIFMARIFYFTNA